MIKELTVILIITCCSIEHSHSQDLASSPDTISVRSDNLTLKGLLWRPSGSGIFPAIIFCHGYFGISDTIISVEQQVSSLGPVFAGKGYIFLGLFRRGVGLSKGQGENSADLMSKAFKEKRQEGRNKVQIQQLETDELQDVIGGLTFLRRRQDVDTNRLAVIGHSLGGSLALLLAEHDPGLKAVVTFGAAGYSWDRSPRLRARLIRAVKNITAPIMIIHAQNDYSTNPGHALDSLMNRLNKPHLIKIYSPFGNSGFEGHNIISLSIKTWEADVFQFLDKNLRR